MILAEDLAVQVQSLTFSLALAGLQEHPSSKEHEHEHDGSLFVHVFHMFPLFSTLLVAPTLELCSSSLTLRQTSIQMISNGERITDK